MEGRDPERIKLRRPINIDEIAQNVDSTAYIIDIADLGFREPPVEEKNDEVQPMEEKKEEVVTRQEITPPVQSSIPSITPSVLATVTPSIPLVFKDVDEDDFSLDIEDRQEESHPSMESDEPVDESVDESVDQPVNEEATYQTCPNSPVNESVDEEAASYTCPNPPAEHTEEETKQIEQEEEQIEHTEKIEQIEQNEQIEHTEQEKQEIKEPEQTEQIDSPSNSPSASPDSDRPLSKIVFTNRKTASKEELDNSNSGLASPSSVDCPASPSFIDSSCIPTVKKKEEVQMDSPGSDGQGRRKKAIRKKQKKIEERKKAEETEKKSVTFRVYSIFKNIFKLSVFIPLLILQAFSMGGLGNSLEVRIRDSLPSSFYGTVLSLLVSFLPLVVSLVMGVYGIINIFIVRSPDSKNSRKKGYLFDTLNITTVLPFVMGVAKTAISSILEDRRIVLGVGEFLCEVLYIGFISISCYILYCNFLKTEISKKSVYSVLRSSLPMVVSVMSCVFNILLFRIFLSFSLETVKDVNLLHHRIEIATSSILHIKSALSAAVEIYI